MLTPSSTIRQLPRRVSVAVFLFLLMTQNVSAQYGLDKATPDIIHKPIEGSIANIIIQVLQYVGAIFLILVIIGGIMWMVSGGNEQRVEKAKKIITSAVIGLVIIMLAYAITLFITRSLEEATTSGPSSGDVEVNS